jgi:pimeloyl-ACP methyl ester carboxylesterase
VRTELIAIETDTLPLDGAFHRPDGEATAGAVLLFHGNTMNFYVGAPRFLPPVLTRLGFACLAFNRRGHDILSIRNSRAAEGAAFQFTREGIADNRYAAAWLAEQGFPNPIVIGHSNGGMLAVKHVSDHPQTPAMVLLSAHSGGRGGVERTSRAGLLAGDRLEEITACSNWRRRSAVRRYSSAATRKTLTPTLPKLSERAPAAPATSRSCRTATTSMSAARPRSATSLPAGSRAL